MVLKKLRFLQNHWQSPCVLATLKKLPSGPWWGIEITFRHSKKVAFASLHLCMETMTFEYHFMRGYHLITSTLVEHLARSDRHLGEKTTCCSFEKPFFVAFMQCLKKLVAFFSDCRRSIEARKRRADSQEIRVLWAKAESTSYFWWLVDNWKQNKVICTFSRENILLWLSFLFVTGVKRTGTCCIFLWQIFAIHKGPPTAIHSTQMLSFILGTYYTICNQYVQHPIHHERHFFGSSM